VKSNEEDNMARSIVKQWIIGLCGLFLVAFGPHSAICAETIKDPLYKVRCSADQMVVEMIKPLDVKAVYLEHLKNYPVEACQPQIEGDQATFRLNLQDIYQCMVTKVLDKATGRKTFYHRIITEFESRPKQVFLVKCDTSFKNEAVIVKRSARPQFPNFRGVDYDIEITDEIVGRAPIPELIVGVKQDGALIDEELTVKPGTPLNMEIYLDNLSAGIYGLMVSGLDVTDTIQSQESLIVNGCTVDPVLFENFLTEDGDLLRAKFQAFKFPETNFVLFKGIVNVCLDRCNGVQCSNGQVGFGRRKKRDLDDSPAAIQRVYEVSMSTIVKVGGNSTDIVVKDSQGNRKETFVSEEAMISEIYHPEELAVARLSEAFGASPAKYIDFHQDNSSASMKTTMFVSMVLMAFMVALLWAWKSPSTDFNPGFFF